MFLDSTLEALRAWILGEELMMRKKVVVNLSRVRDRLVPRIVGTQIDKMIFDFTAPRIKKQVLLHSRFDGSPVFCVVHYNAPDYLLLNISQIVTLYPRSKIYVLDNGSQQANIDAVVEGLKRYNNITLFAASTEYPNWQTKIGADRLLYSHAKGLQFLLNYATEQHDAIVVFLDQDCILSRNIDDLFGKFGKNVLLIGARLIDDLVHASFMILQPKRINKLFGKFSLFHEHTSSPEPYQGICFKTKGKILFLEGKGHDQIPFLTSYSIQDTIYAWHAWYSSRINPKMLSEGVSVSWFRTVRQLAYEYMKQIHEETNHRSRARRARSS